MIEGLIVWGTIAALTALVVLAISRKQFFTRHSGIAHLTAFHDWSPKDKQEAIEIVLERNAGKKMEEISSEDGSKKEE